MAAGPKPSLARVHSTRLTYRSLATAPNWPGQCGPHDAACVCTQRAHGAARSKRVPWHGSRWLTGGYPMAKLCMDVDPCDGASLGTVWPEAVGVDRPRRGPHGAQRAVWRFQRLDDPREDIHRKHPWTSVHLPDMVPGTKSKREGRTTERRSSSARSMVPELNGGEGAGPSGRGAALGSGEALGPTHGKRGGVRWLGTDSVVGTEARRGGGNLPKADKKPRTWTTSNGVASSYKRARSEGDGMARACRPVHDRAWIVGACTRGRRAHRGINQQKLVWR
jgi:hypothetical protein